MKAKHTVDTPYAGSYAEVMASSRTINATISSNPMFANLDRLRLRQKVIGTYYGASKELVARVNALSDQDLINSIDTMNKILAVSR